MGIFLTRGESSYDPFRDLALLEQFQESCSCNFQNSLGRFSRSPCLLLCEEDHVDSALGKQPVLIVTAVSQAALITGGWNWHLVKCYWRALLSALPCLRRPGWKEGFCQPHPCNVKVYFFFFTNVEILLLEKGVRRQTNCHFWGEKIAYLHPLWTLQIYLCGVPEEGKRGKLLIWEPVVTNEWQQMDFSKMNLSRAQFMMRGEILP